MVALVLGSCAPQALAGSPSGFADLLQVYEGAVEHAPELEQARHEKDVGQERRNQGRAGLLPSVSLSAELTRDREWSDQLDPATGELDATRRDAEQQRYQLSLTQPLFRLDRWYGYREGRAASQEAERQFEGRRQAFLQEVISTYLGALREQVRLRTVQSRVDAIAAQRRQARSQLEAGLASGLDVQEAEAELKRAELEQVQAVSAFEQALEELNSLAGFLTERVAALSDTFDPRDHSLPPVETLLESARLGNARIQTLETSVRRADLKSRETLSAFAPDVDLTLRGQREKTDILEGPGADTRGGDDLDSIVVGVQLSMPLFSGGRRVSEYRASRSERERAHEQRRVAVIEAEKGVRASAQSLATLEEATAVAEVSVVTAEETLAATERAQAAGLRDTVDVLRAQRELFDAKHESEEVRLDYLESLTELRLQTGTLDKAFVETLNQWLRGNS